jgi:hypothetical protein
MNKTDSMLDPTGSRRMRPAQTWYWIAPNASCPDMVGWPLVARGSRGSQPGKNLPHRYEKGMQCRKNNKRRLPCLAVAHTMTTLQYVGSGLL